MRNGEERETRDREWEEKMRVHEEQRCLIELEDKRIEILKEYIKQWREAEEIRSYLVMVQNKTKASSDRDNLSNWYEWVLVSNNQLLVNSWL